jgi:hypothetical protein
LVAKVWDAGGVIGYHQGRLDLDASLSWGKRWMDLP